MRREATKPTSLRARGILREKPCYVEVILSFCNLQSKSLKFCIMKELEEPSPNFEPIFELLRYGQVLAKQAVILYEPEVKRLIKSNCRDENEIERTLDYMLSFCFDNDMLQLYRKLCQHLYFINPHAAISYVNYYREMYDDSYVSPEQARLN